VEKREKLSDPLDNGGSKKYGFRPHPAFCGRPTDAGQ
jgi:hypothetical protein